MLAEHNTKSVALPPRKIIRYFPPVKDALVLRTPDVYSFQCEFYIVKVHIQDILCSNLAAAYLWRCVLEG
jgi:hypothetical protein